VSAPSEPFAFADFSWVPGNYGSGEKPLKAGPFTGELRLDAAYHYSFNHPKDDTISGSSEVFRHNEFQLTQIGFGGDFLYKNVQARLNGWQSYGRFNQAPGVGLQVQWRPTGSLALLGNQYVGTDTLNTPGRKRIHTDDSVMVKYHDDPRGVLSKAAASLTIDAGCEEGGGVGCGNQYFLGFMAYSRLWFFQNHLATTVGGGAITNPGRSSTGPRRPSRPATAPTPPTPT
jgi:hypothetical protein